MHLSKNELLDPSYASFWDPKQVPKKTNVESRVITCVRIIIKETNYIYAIVIPLKLMV